MYIDADELIAWIVNEPSKVGDTDIPLNHEYDGSVFRQIEILGHIESMPTADVVEVVRCKDCKHRDGDYCHRFADGYSAFIHRDDFCKYGERRDDE